MGAESCAERAAEVSGQCTALLSLSVAPLLQASVCGCVVVFSVCVQCTGDRAALRMGLFITS